jgi:hypothetical protein
MGKGKQSPIAIKKDLALMARPQKLLLKVFLFNGHPLKAT